LHAIFVFQYNIDQCEARVMGPLIGALVMTSLTSGVNLMSFDISYQYVVRALVLVAAVLFDVTTRSQGK